MERIDLGEIFFPRISDKRDDINFKSTGYQYSGVATTILNEDPIDISNFYEKSTGNGIAADDQIDYDTNYKFSGVDLRYYFRKK
jgi:hypothetical protein